VERSIPQWPSNLTREDVIKNLRELGFKQYKPKAKAWSYTLIASNENQTIYFLIGKRGIDFKLYDGILKTEFTDYGRVVTNGGLMVRNYYHESDVNVHQLILEIATLFIENKDIPNSLLVGHGKSWQARKEEYIKNLPKTKKTRNDGLDMYNAMAHEDGEDAYLGGGMWITPSGSFYDKGR